MAETLFELSFDSNDDLVDSRTISSEGSGSKSLGSIGNSDDSALKVSLAEGDFRSEVGYRSYREFEEGGRYSIEWQMYVPEDFADYQTEGDWGTIVHQWGLRVNDNTTKLDNPGKSYMIINRNEELIFRPTVYLGRENGQYLLSHDATYNMGKVEKNKWINFKQELIPAADDSGLVKIWKDGELVADHRGPIIPPGDGYKNFEIWKVGAYTQRKNSGTRKLWFDDIVIKEIGDEETIEPPSSTPDVEPPSSTSDVEPPSSTSDVSPTKLDISGMPIEIWKRAEGTQVSRTFTLESLDNWQNPSLEITAFDIDKQAEVKMFLNEQEVALPEGIVENNGGYLSDSVAVDRGLLVAGNNEITFEFASNLNNTTQGFAIDKLALTR